jgi:hypothetical protein
MTSRRRLRRSAAVPRNLLNLLVRRFFAAVLRWFAAVPKNSIISMCGGPAAVGVRNPHTPMRSAAPDSAPRVHGRSRGQTEPAKAQRGCVTSRMTGSIGAKAGCGGDLSLVLSCRRQARRGLRQR